MKFRLPPNWKISPQKGGALFALLAIVGIAAAVLFVGTLSRKTSQLEHDKQTAVALAQAKDALIGYAATYRDSHSNEVFGYFLCPDTNNDGEAESSCAAADAPVIGRLPWKTLGLPALRDGAGECLWYAVSGTFKNNPKTTAMLNWDTNGQFSIQDSGGTTIAGATPESRAVAVIFSSGPALSGQDRAPSGTSECGGNTSITAYLEGNNAATLPVSAPFETTLTNGVPNSGTNNDQFLWISPGEIFKGIKLRADFKTDIDAMVVDLAACLNAKIVSSLPTPSGSKGIDSVVTACPPVGPQKTNVLNNWKDNLLYAKISPATKITIDGAPSPKACNAIILFGGERTNTQNRSTSADKDSAANYLEGANLTSFPTGTTYSGASSFNRTGTSQDIVACITGSNPGSVSFASNFSDFVSSTTIGGVTTDTINKTVTLVPAAAGNAAGCFWYPNPLALYTVGSNLTLRAYYEFTFAKKDNQNTVRFFPWPQASSQYGYGFTFAVVRGDLEFPPLPTTGTCGTAVSTGIAGGTMGALATTNLFLETDTWSPSTPNTSIERPYTTSGTNRAFQGNHIAIRSNSNLAPATNDVTSACDGTRAGCYKAGEPTWMEDPSGGSPATATIKIGNSGSNNSVSITDVKVNGISIINTTITAAGGTNTTNERRTVANNLAAAINSYVSSPDYTACAGTACTPALATDTVKVISVANGTGPNGYVVQVISPQAGTPATARVRFTRTNAGASVTSVTVNGVEILNAAVIAVGSNGTARRRSLAQGVCNGINTYLNGAPFEYTAAATAAGATCPTSSDTFYIQAPISAGATPNGYPVVITPPSSPAPLTYTVANGSTLAGGVSSTLPVTDASGNTPILMSGGSGTLPNERIEIMTRCDNTCTTCNTPTGTRMLVKSWAQCTGCSDTSVDYPGAPMAKACINMGATAIPRMDKVKFGFTAGSLAAPNNQSATIQNFVLTIN